MNPAQYCDLGWHVIQLHWIMDNGDCSCRKTDCSHPGKHPMWDGWKDKATANRIEILARWQMYPQANVGVVTGKRSGIVVLDVDTREGKRITKHKGLRPTRAAITGSGGWHIYWKADREYPNRVGIFSGVDVRGENGYVVAPPSIHANGVLYEWHREGETIAPPRWFHEAMKRKAYTRKESDPDLENIADRVGEISEGGRNNRLYSIARRLYKDGTMQGDIEKVINSINAKCCTPALEQREVDRLLWSATRK